MQWAGEVFVKYHFRPKWTSRLKAAIGFLAVYRPNWTSCLLGALWLFVGSLCVLIAWCVIQNERRLAEEEWEAIRAMEVNRNASPSEIAKPPARESRAPVALP